MRRKAAVHRWSEAAGSDEAGRGAADVFTPLARAALLAAVIALIVLRLPHAWTHGRFLDEEATVFLAYAWHRPWFDALLRPFAGYLNLAATASTTLTAALVRHGIVSLDHAPYVTMAIALAGQSVPALLILTGRARWLADRATVVAALLVLALAPTAEEVFFNVLHIQFHLALAAALILALDVPRRRATRCAYAILLGLAALCGPGAILLVPLFAGRAIVERDRGRWRQTIALAVAAAIQLLAFYQASPVRGHPRGPETILAMIAIRLIVMPVAGFANAFHVGEATNASWLAGGSLWREEAGAAAAAVVLLAAVAVRRRDGAVWLLLSSLVIAAASFGFGAIMPFASDLFSPGAGARYNYLPLVLLLWAVIVIARRPGRWRAIWALPGVVVLSFAAVEYFRPLPEWADGPAWPAEVAAWRRDHRHPLAVWPRPLAADLSDKNHRCSPPGRDVLPGAEPRFCENGYRAGLLRLSLGR